MIGQNDHNWVKTVDLPARYADFDLTLRGGCCSRLETLHFHLLTKDDASNTDNN